MKVQKSMAIMALFLGLAGAELAATRRAKPKQRLDDLASTKIESRKRKLSTMKGASREEQAAVANAKGHVKRLQTAQKNLRDTGYVGGAANRSDAQNNYKNLRVESKSKKATIAELEKRIASRGFLARFGSDHKRDLKALEMARGSLSSVKDKKMALREDKDVQSMRSYRKEKMKVREALVSSKAALKNVAVVRDFAERNAARSEQSKRAAASRKAAEQAEINHRNKVIRERNAARGFYTDN
jgi:hypothetical protein